MRLLLNIKQIANELGLECWEDKGIFNVKIGMADWDNTGIENELVLRYYHGCYSDDWVPLPRFTQRLSVTLSVTATQHVSTGTSSS